MPNRNDGNTEGCDAAPSWADWESLAPMVTSGAITRSPRAGKSSVNPKSARITSAIARPYWFASTTQPPATAAKVATAANVTHAQQHWQSGANERLVRARENKRQDWQNAGTGDGENTAEISERQQNHGRVSRNQAAAGLKVIATPFMQ